MKVKTSFLLLVALLLCALQFPLRAQNPDCYDIQCPSKVFAPCEGVYGAHAWFSVTASNRCNPDQPPTIQYSVPPGSVFPPGTNVVCATIQIPGLAPRQCCFDVIVDKCCPTNCIDVICPRNIVVACQQTPTGPGAFVTLPKPFATNYCGDHVLPPNLQWQCTPQTVAGQPTFFPPGTNKVVWCLTDGQGYKNCCCFDVIVTNCPATHDQCRPEIICPTAMQIQCEGPNGAIVSFPPPKITDPCGLVIATNYSHTSGTFFQNGKTTVVICIKWQDPATGEIHSECCCFDVIVRCCPPTTTTNCVTTLNCPTNIVIDCPPTTGVTLNYSASGSNSCESTTLVCTPPSGSTIYGPTNVCCRLLNASGSVLTQCCFRVTVKDSTPPVINCPQNLTAVSGNCQPVAVNLPPVTATDNCDPNPVVACVPNSNVFPCGNTTVNCTAVDASGNSNKCSFIVTVRCNSQTSITCSPDLFFDCTSPTGVVATYTATATNTCTNIVSISCTPPSGSVFPPGTNLVCCHATAATGESNVCCFKVVVMADDIPPSIKCPTNIVVTSQNCTPLDVQYPPPSASDNCALSSVNCIPPTGSAFPTGVTTVKCCAADRAGNSNCCTFTVTVLCPSNDCVRIVCPSNIVIDCAGPNGVPVTYNAYATNFCNGGLLPVTCSRPSGSFFPLGITTVCCTNITGTAVQWCCFEVNVKRDTQPPVINCPTNLYILCAKPNGAKVNYIVTATDNCAPAPTITCVPPSGSLFTIGCTNVTCVAVDGAGNSSTCSFKVCLLAEGCYLRNPSFELLASPLPASLACGDPIGFALGWTALAGTPDLWRPPFASLVPGNCRGRENPCQGTNYAGLEGGYSVTGAFATEEMMGTLIAPLSNGQKFRLRACLSLAETSPGPVLLEFVLANSANLAQQQVIHQVWVIQKNGWIQYLPPCFTVPQQGKWDRLIIRTAKVPAGAQTYQTGYAYVDNVNICCCKPVLHDVVVAGADVAVRWEGAGQLQVTDSLSEPVVWRNVTTPVETDPETGDYSIRLPRSPRNVFFRVVGSDSTVGCSECGDGTSGE